ncbi:MULTISPECIES: hypothetical protein [unclassified Candidatus Frackibacter]|uniref:hypothetical protein n=1 Tax=unclassified Candidatus Frackibacter TaxID=2648818 RepID=UPI00079C09E9|nr:MULTISPECIES: hypothetical protein [unclassified Candidatus Frackibacter]KXS43032.1 MAG: biotin biosynthesis protein BioX [Candidatus Frackibacter sp. T328-2]SDC17956.1 hypothetical protein SAMN04515661_103113 [Candidatus Frackibacter sp. WG11]SEM44116.1 hypothetical protein SAMN04488698_10427 [Candidatus Frackibacter sp. WG12]SFL46620.1 hypothetical protein SAMN04488699_10327 [Candidatus Frackibacter sp. WG13]
MINKSKRLTRIALLAVLITVSGAFKIPGPAGTDFQLSAPLAVAIAAVFGFKRYILAGVISSTVGFILGTQTLIHIGIAMIFRVVAGSLVTLVGPVIWAIIIAGPLGSILARIILSEILGQGLIPLLVAALPGIIFTALTAYPLTMVLKGIAEKINKGVGDYVQTTF